MGYEDGVQETCTGTYSECTWNTTGWKERKCYARTGECHKPTMIFAKKTGQGGLLHLKDIGACRKFCKEALKGTKILYCGRGLYIFSPLRGTTAKTTQSLTDIFFSFF